MSNEIVKFKNEKEMSVIFAASHLHLFRKYDTVDGLDQNDYPTDIRVTFTDWMDEQYQTGTLTEEQVSNYTLIEFNRNDFNNYMSQNPDYAEGEL